VHHSIVERSSGSKLPTAEQRATLPIVVKKVDPIKVSRLTQFMNNAAAQRWAELMRLLNTPRIEPSTELMPSMLTDEQAVQFIDAGIMSPIAPDMVKGSGVFFFVVETKLNEETNKYYDRLRPIFWPEKLNTSLKEIYEPNVPLHASGHYIDQVRAECGAVADLKCGFFQFPLSPTARPWFCLQTTSGRTLCMNRLPMGFSMAPEIMQMITEVVFSSPRVCDDASRATTDVWIDDARFTGSETDVATSCERAKKRAAHVHATIKSVDSFAPRKEYPFIGMRCNHLKHAVSVLEKTLLKMATPAERMTVKDLRSNVGRLIFCAGVLRIPLADYYFSIKWVARKVNQQNNGHFNDNSIVDVPPSVVKELKQWIVAAHGERTLSSRGHDASATTHTLFTDASLSGWGGIYSDPYGRVYIAGGKWCHDDGLEGLDHNALVSGDISRLEARGLRRAFDSFSAVIKENQRFLLHVFVDNTSVQAAARRGIARSAGVNEELRHWLRAVVNYDLRYEIDYVKSAENPADAVSRRD